MTDDLVDCIAGKYSELRYIKGETGCQAALETLKQNKENFYLNNEGDETDFLNQSSYTPYKNTVQDLLKVYGTN